MRRIKLVVGVGLVMAAILALSAAPAMADEWNDWDGHHGDWDGHHGFNETIWVDEGTAAFDQWCSPGLPAGIWIPGCIFSDPLEEEVVFFEEDIDFDEVDFDHDDDEIVFLLEEDDFFDHDDDHDDDHDGDRKRRHHHG